MPGDVVPGWLCAACFAGCRESRKLILIIVFFALFLDNMLLTTVVPIIPEFLYHLRHHEDLNSDYEFDWPQPATTEATTTVETHLLSQVPSNYYATATNITVPTTPLVPNKVLKTKHEELMEENMQIGVMFASKSFVQLLTNPFVGPLTNRIGYRIPMLTGFVIMFISTIIFAYGGTYGVLFFARALQGIGSSCCSVSGMGMLAERYPNDKERGNAMGVALGGLALGVLIGPPFGGVMYQFVGRAAPFLILACLALGGGLLQLLELQPGIILRQEIDAPSLKTLIMDPYIIVAAGAILFSNMGIAILEPTLPIWMMDTLDAPKWQLGAVFLPASISYLIGINLFGPLGHRMGRWLAAMIGFFVIGICFICIPFANNINHLIGPNAGLGFAIGMVYSSMMPELGHLIDIRHDAVYGSVYAIGDFAFCLGFAIGPVLSSTLVPAIGFGWMLVGIAIINFMYVPVLYMLRAPPTKEEQ